jgi:hypothetical protein
MTWLVARPPTRKLFCTCPSGTRPSSPNKETSLRNLCKRDCELWKRRLLF